MSQHGYLYLSYLTDQEELTCRDEEYMPLVMKILKRYEEEADGIDPMDWLES